MKSSVATMTDELIKAGDEHIDTTPTPTVEMEDNEMPKQDLPKLEMPDVIADVTNDTSAKKRKRKPRRRRKNIDVKTLFVGGLPMDAKPREIYLMFRKFTGYQGCILKMYGKEGKTASPVAFVTFETREQAETAKSELHGVRFDEQNARTLKIEFARSNTKDAANAISSRAAAATTAAHDQFRIIQPPTVPLDNTAKPTAAAQTAAHTAAAGQVAWPVIPPPMFYDMNGHMYPAFMPPPPPPVAAAQPPVAQPPAPPQNHTAYIPNPELVPSGESSAPCTTLFVANLNHNANEEELKQLFSTVESFCRIKIHHNKGMKPVTFVQYAKLDAAVQAKTMFNGRNLQSAETGGIRIEYAKKDMGELL